MWQHFIDHKIRTDRAFAVPTIRILLACHAFDTIWLSSHFAGVDPYVGSHVQRTAVAVVAIEPVDVGTIQNWFRKVNVWQSFDANRTITMSSLIFGQHGPVPAKMPLADHLSAVACLSH